MDFELTDAPAQADLDALSGNLTAYNDATTEPMNRRLLSVFVRGADGMLLAGLHGYTAWNWLFTQWLWVDESHRGQGVAAQLLARAEAEAVTRGCHGAWIDTFNPVARRTYERAGYVAFGELPDFAAGLARVFLRKSLKSG